jgi:hypothetical protein
MKGSNGMFTKGSINWSEKATIEKEEFPKDTLGRVKYAQFLTQFLVDQGYDSSREEGEDKRNYVLNLNSEWGSGKTYFLKRWSNDLKPHFPVVYIDAWQQDYSDDPLMTVISSVINQLREQAGIDVKKSDFTIPNKVVGLLKAAAPALIKTFSKKYFGDEDFIDLSDVAADAVTHLIDEHEEKSQAISDLKDSVSEWVSFVTDNPKDKKQYPAFIFIDELDRCRPSYAVEMLETIKHIFDIKGIVFVVATDTEQLQHAVKAIYGEGFNARLYLGRFFNSRFTLKAPNLKDFLEVHVDHHKLSGEYLKKAEISILPPNEDSKITLRNIAVILDAFNMPPRTAIQVTDRVIATLSNMPKGSKIDLLMLTILLCFKEENHKRCIDIISNRLNYKSENGKIIGVDAYINQRFSNCTSTISMRFNPRDIHQKFKTTEGYTADNQYKEGVYQVTLFRYFECIFLVNLGSKKSISSDVIQDKLVKSTNTQRPNEVFESGILWLQAQYIKSRFNQIPKETYQDYVELASALDWIDGDSGSDDL